MIVENKVVRACEKHWDEWKSDCSGFVKAVARELGVSLQGQANDIVECLLVDPWRPLGSGVQAAEMAEAGLLVVGGLKVLAGHGHVVVVVPGELDRDKYPCAYWGKLGGIGRKNETINWAWTAADRDHVVYGACTID